MHVSGQPAWHGETRVRRVDSLHARVLAGLLPLLLLVVSTTAFAQGTGEQLPDPMGSRVLSRDLDRFVSPTVSQWGLIEDLHEAYLERFALLRDGDIARFLEFAQKEMGAVPDARTAKEFVRRLDATRARINEEDARLFGEIAEILDEGQLAGLNRVRLARERESLTSGFAAQEPGIDLWEILTSFEREIGPEGFTTIDPVLIGYEEELTAGLRAWRKAQTSMFMVLVEELQNRGLGEVYGNASANSEEAQKAIKAFQAAYESAQVEGLKVRQRIESLDRKSFERIESLLGEDVGRRVRMACVERASEGRIPRDPLNVDRTFTRLLEKDELSPDQRDQLQVLRRGMHTADDRHVVRMTELLQELSEIEDPLMRFEIVLDSEDPVLEQIRKLRESIDERAGLRAALAESTHSELLRLFEASASPRQIAIIESGGRNTELEEDRPEYPESSSVRNPRRGGPSDFIPERLTRRELERIRRELDPEPWQQAILDTIHEDYVAAWKNQIAPIDEQCSSAQASIYSVNPDTKRQKADVSKLQLAYAHAHDATERIVDLERSFFDDLGGAMSSKQESALLRFRLERELDRYLRGTDPFFSPGQTAYRPANVFEVVDELELDPEKSSRLDAYFMSEGVEFLEQARLARDLRFNSEQRFHEMNIRLSQGMADGTLTSTDHGLEYRRISDELSGQYGEQVEAWNLAQTGFIEGLSQRLDPEPKALFLSAWKRATNPYVYRDPNSATVPIDLSLQFSDLTSEQLDAIAEVLAEYDREWNRLSSDMVVLKKQLNGFGANSSPDEYGTWQALQQRYAALDFERNEASHRALRRLHRYLTPEQRRRIRALDRIEL